MLYIYIWIDLNKKYDNHKSPIDCYASFEREWKKIFEDMICFCISEDEKIVERIYKFPLIEIKRVTCIIIIGRKGSGVLFCTITKSYAAFPVIK